MRACLLLLLLAGTCWAGGTPRFTDVTATSGLKLNPTDQKGQPGYGAQMPHGVAVADFDGDGLPDILIVCFGEPHVKLYRNLGGLKFADVTAGSGLETFQGLGTGVAVGDFDRDGKPDVYITSLAGDAKGKPAPPGTESRLFRNLGNFKFADVSAERGTLFKLPARSCAWSDIDGDGHLDLFVCCPHSASVLFRNNGNGTFTDITAQAGLALADRHNLGCAFGDIDGDGRDDLFVTSYNSQVSTLFKNLGGGKFVDITAAAGLGRKCSAVGCVFADVFNRGKLDLYVTTDSWLSGANYTEAELLKQGKTVEPNVLYENLGQGKFAPVAAATLAFKGLAHDAILEDLDHDGLLDIYVGVDAIPSGNKYATSKGGNPLWTRPDGKTWQEVSKAWGVAHEANCVCVPAADFDNDGDLDLLLINFYTNVVLYRNNTNDKNWLRVKAQGTKSNRDGIGAQVRLYDTTGGQKKLVGLRHIQSGSGYGRCSALEAHFGLGPKPAPHYRVEVFFPATKTLMVRDQVAPGQRITIEEKTNEP
jgi:hypothetical protein